MIKIMLFLKFSQLISTHWLLNFRGQSIYFILFFIIIYFKAQIFRKPYIYIACAGKNKGREFYFTTGFFINYSKKR